MNKLQLFTRWLMNHSLNVQTVVRTSKRIRRNDKCTCGSGKKFKKCCLPNFIQKKADNLKSPEYKKSEIKITKYYNKKYKELKNEKI